MIMKKTLHTIVACLLVSHALAENIVFPSSPDAGVINVKTAYGAIGDGVADDTAAIQAAITANAGTFGRVLYFPNGTYLVSATISCGATIAAAKGVTLQGQSQAGTILRLKDSAAGFTNAGSPQPVLASFTGTGSDNQAFGNNIFNLTIDTGSGNAGAIALSHLTNNYGSVREVTLRSSDANHIGANGLLMAQAWPGPGMIRNLTVDGFSYGIAIYNAEYSMTFEGITLRNQSTAGILNSGNIVSVHSLTSTNTVPVLAGTAGSLSVILSANCTGGSATRSAFELSGGMCLLRNIVTTGYQSAVKNNATVVSGANQGEYVNSTPLSLFASPPTTLGMPIENTPEVAWDDVSKWASVTSYGAVADDTNDDTSAIQAAIDNAVGKTTIYFPRGKYFVSGTIHIRNGVKRIYGAGSAIRFTNALYAQAVPVFQFDNTSAPVVVFELFVTDYPTATANFTLFKHNSASAVVLRNLAINAGQAYTSTAGSGPLFVEDVAGNSWQINQQTAWMRQVNPEAPRGYTKIINNGGRLWILGLKTEKDDNVIASTNGAATEVLGDLLYPAGTVDAAKIAFTSTDSALSVSIGASSYAAGNLYTNFVQETRSGTTLTLPITSLVARNPGRICPLYVGYIAKPAPFDTDADGMPDYWETLHGLDPLNAADAALDADGDGRSNLAEYRAGTDPRANGDFFSIGSISATGSTRAFTFNARTDHAYTVQYSDDLATGPWLTLGTIPASAARTINTSTPMNMPRRFYRVIATP